MLNSNKDYSFNFNSQRQDTISLVMPTSGQQVSFTALVVLAFSLKTFDIIHLIFRQATTDTFFIDWEKPKSGKNKKKQWIKYLIIMLYHFREEK